MHAIGHIAANISFAAVAISLTHTVKTLEPAFNVILSRLVSSTTACLGLLMQDQVVASQWDVGGCIWLVQAAV